MQRGPFSVMKESAATWYVVVSRREDKARRRFGTDATANQHPQSNEEKVIRSGNRASY